MATNTAWNGLPDLLGILGPKGGRIRLGRSALLVRRGSDQMGSFRLFGLQVARLIQS
jgi:hypothetical protein